MLLPYLWWFLFLKHCTCVFTCALAWVWCQRKLAEVSSRLLFGFQELNSGYLTWLQVPLLAEPSRQPWSFENPGKAKGPKQMEKELKTRLLFP